MSTTDVVRIGQQGPAAEEEQGRLKADLQYLRKRGLLRGSGDLSYQGRKCARCGAPFGRFYNTGASCTRCKYRVCRQCRIEVRGQPDNKDVEWICNVCYKIAEFHVATSKWMYDNPGPKGSIAEKTSPSPVEILKHSIRRAWTINGPPTRWSAARKSPELRIYRSLPSRHQEYREGLTRKENSKSTDSGSLKSDEKQSTEGGEQHKDKQSTKNEANCPEKGVSRAENNNERTNARRGERPEVKQEEEVPSGDVVKQGKSDGPSATAGNRTKTEEQEDTISNQEQSTPRISLIKPPRILSKLISPEIKPSQPRHGERKSNIPIFKRSSKEFEDIRSPQESPKRSLIPQRYRGSTDDLRRSREDISIPSLIPKLLSPRNKEDRLKRQDSKDDIRPVAKPGRKEQRDEAKSSGQTVNREEAKHGIRLFRRESSREDVGRDTTVNSNANAPFVAGKGRQACRDERQERAEERVGVLAALKTKFTTSEPARPKLPGRENKEETLEASEGTGRDEDGQRTEQNERTDELRTEEGTMLGGIVEIEKSFEGQENTRRSDEKKKEETDGGEEKVPMVEQEQETFEYKRSFDDSMKEIADDLLDSSEPDAHVLGAGERKYLADVAHGKKSDDFQVVRRKFSKEEFSNPDDTDDTPNKRCSSHLSPEASPLSTRSSRYSPRESESEPTPALPRKTGDSCSASQRIRDAITRTRRESNSSARYESSGSESVRLSEAGLHGYADLARKVKFFGGGGGGAIPLAIGSDEGPVQRDSATSAGEDEPHDDGHGRAGPISSQGRSLLRRRRQFDAQGSRRRGRSHARSYCAEDLQNFQALNVVERGRQQSPTGNGQGQEQPILDYRRLVFISSDSSSGREEDDADSSCSSSSYLNGLPRSGSHAQSLEDCDWDYFESGSLPLPPGVPVTIGPNSVGIEGIGSQDWSCCPGRGSAACQACGGSRGANVLPVPVPIPVPVPYPVPIPAALWTGDFAAAASSMISRTGDAHTEPGTLRLRGDPAAPWFAWHPRFNQPLHGARLDPRLPGVFDPTTCTFRPEQVLAPRLYGNTVESSSISSAEKLQQRLANSRTGREEKDSGGTTTSPKVPDESLLDVREPKPGDQQKATKKPEERNVGRGEKSKESNDSTNTGEQSGEADVGCQDSLTASFERRGQRMYQHSHEDSGSSSGRSSADSSDLEEDSSSHRFSRVFVVNDDSLTSDNDIEDNGDEDEDSDSAAVGGVTLKRVTALPDEEPVVLQYVRLLGEDGTVETQNGDRTKANEKSEMEQEERVRSSKNNNTQSERRKIRGRRNSAETDNDDKHVPYLLQHRAMPEEMYLADDNDCTEGQIELKSIKTLDPDSIEIPSTKRSDEAFPPPKAEAVSDDEELIIKPEHDSSVRDRSRAQHGTTDENVSLSLEAKSLSTDAFDSNIIPDSLEITSEEICQNDRLSLDTPDSRHGKFRVSTPATVHDAGNNSNSDITVPEDSCFGTEADKSISLSQIAPYEEDPVDDKPGSDRASDLHSAVTMAMNGSSTTDSFTSNETNTTGSEVSSDELHEYEVTPARPASCYENPEPTVSALNGELLFRLGKRNIKETASQWRKRDGGQDNFKDDDRREESSANGSSTARRSMQTRSGQPSDNSSESGLRAGETEKDSVTEDSVTSLCEKPTSDPRESEEEEEEKEENNDPAENGRSAELKAAGCDVGDIITNKIQEMFKSADSKVESAHDAGPCVVRGESPGSGQVVGEVCGGGGEGGSGSDGVGAAGGSDGGGGGGGGGGGDIEEGIEGGATRFRSVERRPSTRKENGFPAGVSRKDPIKDVQQQLSPAASNNNGNSNNNNKYRSLVMITQEASYQPVSVITSDTTTLLQPDEVHASSQGLAGYFQLALEAVTEQPHRKNGQGPRKPLMVKRLASTATSQSEIEVDSGLSVGSASETDDVSVKSVSKITGKIQENNEDVAIKDRPINEHRDGTRARVSSQSSDDNSGSGGVVILEEGLADDDSWVEEVSHDEDEPGATTATEESSEDEANNLGDREEELRGYHRQAIDFTLHTIVEESCEESEAEPSLATGSPSKKQRPPSASELEKYFFFGLGGDGNNSSMGSREVDSLSETSSIYSEGLESLGQDESPGNGQSQDRSNSGEGFLNSSRLEKYFLSEFLGFDQDRRDSDGSVGSDSEGRPSPEAQRRKRLVRARGTGRSHSSSLDNLLALTQSSQNLSSQNSLQDLSLNQDTQETQSEGSSTETDGADDGQTAVFGTDGQFDTVKRKKKKPRNLGTQSPRVPDDRNKTPEPSREMVLVGEVVMENEAEAINSEDSERAKTPQPESVLSPSSSPATAANASTTSSLQADSSRNVQISSGESVNYSQRSKQQSRDSGFVGSCDDLLQHQKLPEDAQTSAEDSPESAKDSSRKENEEIAQTVNQTATEGAAEAEKGSVTKIDHPVSHATMPHLPSASLSRKDSFNNWSSDEETNLMMSKMRQFFKTMVANTNGQGQSAASTNSTGASPAPSPRLPGYSSKARLCAQNRTKPPQLVYFENELTRLMKTVPGIRDEQVREIVEYLSSEDTWSDSYDSSDYTSSDLEGAAGGRRSALQEQISQSCQQIISKFDTTSGDGLLDKDRDDKTGPTGMQPQCLGRDTAFVYQKLVQSFTKMAGDGVSSDANSTPHSSPPLIAKVMHHIGSRLVALMHEVSEGGPAAQHHTTWRRYSQHHRTPSSASTTEDDDSTSDSTNAPSSAHLQLPRSKSHDPLLLINSHPAASTGQEGEEREASDYERFSWRGSFESALMAADSRTKLSLLACSGDVSVGASASASALAMAAKRRSAGDLLFNPKSFSREQLDRVRSCGSIGGGSGGGASGCGGSIEERIWSNRRRSSVPDANTRGESGASAGDEDTEDELEYGGESRATTLPRGMQSAMAAATNSLPRLPASTAPTGLTTTSATPSASMHKAHSVYHFLPQHSGVKSARYRPPGFARNSNVPSAIGGPKRAVSAPGLQVSGSQASAGKRDNSRSRRQQAMSLTPDDGSSLSEACSTPIIGAGSRTGSSHTVIDVDDMDPGLHSSHLATRASLSSLGARSDSMASVYSGAGEGRCCRSVVVTGEVEFALQYDYKHLTFEVHVTKCKNLAPVDVKRKRSDPYVKVYLLPDKSKSGKRKTKVKKHTLNPEFNETLKFHMSLSGLETRTLWLTVWHSDMFGRNDFLGEVRMPLENKIFDDPTPKWYPLQERTEPFDDPIAYKGEVIVGLKFVPPDPAQQQERETGSDRGASKSRKNWSRGALHVLVKEARNLQTRAKNSGTCDPFCKSYLLPDKGRSGKQKTGVVRRCGGSPVWGHTFIYKDVSLQELAERGLELTVWDHDRIASNEFLGGVRFNLGTGKHYGKPVDWMDATGRELSLWQNMLERPNFWVEGAVTLRPNLHNHGKNSGS